MLEPTGDRLTIIQVKLTMNQITNKPPILDPASVGIIDGEE